MDKLKSEKLKSFFSQNSETAVAFSGGVDSAVLLMYAVRYAKRVKAYFVKSQFQPQFELEDALRVAEMLNAELEVISADILCDEKVASNPENRCYYCKKRVFGAILTAAGKDGFDTVLDGTNFTDDISDRPGYKALQEMKVLSPLRECGISKAEIRAAAEDNGLSVAHKPSYACLATRIPCGTYITAELLEITEAAENELKSLGFSNFRVRYDDGAARLELGKREHALLKEKREQVIQILLKYYNDFYVESKERADE